MAGSLLVVATTVGSLLGLGLHQPHAHTSMQLINVADAADAQIGARTRHIGASLLGNLGLRLHGLRPSP